MDKIEVTPYSYDILRIAPNNFTELLRITPTGEVIAPSLEAASEAGRYFVQSMRGHLEVMREAIRAEILATRTDATPVARKQFPILGSRGAKIDLQLVEDHGKQAYSNHYQTVERLAERGGLSWCELHAVLNNRPWQKLDENTAIAECRAIEARYLGAFNPPATDVAALVEVIARDYWNMLRKRGGMPPEDTCPQGREDIRGPIAFALAPSTKGQP